VADLDQAFAFLEVGAVGGPMGRDFALQFVLLDLPLLRHLDTWNEWSIRPSSFSTYLACASLADFRHGTVSLKGAAAFLRKEGAAQARDANQTTPVTQRGEIDAPKAHQCCILTHRSFAAVQPPILSRST
jgi:hypothetical protein